MFTTILGIKIDIITKSQALGRVTDFLHDKKQHLIFTPNPEILVKAHADGYFKQVLNQSDLNICDGFGLWLAIKMGEGKRGNSKFERIPGTDFMVEVCRLAAEQGKTVYLLGSGVDETVKKTVQELQKQFPRLKIVGWDKGPEIAEISQFTVHGNITIEQLNNKTGLTISPEKNSKLITDINSKKTDILFVAFGMGKQEKWLSENLTHLPGVSVAMGVGGAFDYLSGKTKRAPRLLQKIGLEWLYRLYREPWRLKRIWNATVKFIYLLSREKCV